jgi:carbonic anhydrase
VCNDNRVTTEDIIDVQAGEIFVLQNVFSV